MPACAWNRTAQLGETEFRHGLMNERSAIVESGGGGGITDYVPVGYPGLRVVQAVSPEGGEQGVLIVRPSGARSSKSFPTIMSNPDANSHPPHPIDQKRPPEGGLL